MSRTVPSFAEEGLKRFLHGMDRRIRDLERLGDWRFDTDTDPDSANVAIRNASQLLVMTGSAVSVASGGAFLAFESIVAQHGFSTVSGASGSWTHPVSGVYLLTYEHAWNTYQAGGAIHLEIDGVAIPEGVLATGTEGAKGRGVVAYWADAEAVGRIKITQTSGAAQTCDATVHVAITDPEASSGSTPIDTFYVDSRVHSQHPTHNTYAQSAVVLGAGSSYRVVVTGNFARSGEDPMTLGAPDDIMFPSSGQPVRDATEDAEVWYAYVSGGPYPTHHDSGLRFDSGTGWGHVEPDAGPQSTPADGHSYAYTIVGQGVALKAAIYDTPLTDNNGLLQVDIYGVG